MSQWCLDETIAAVGYVKVIVALKPDAPAGAALARRNGRGVPPLFDKGALEAALESKFIIPNESQVEQLTASAALMASKRTRARPAEPPRVRVYPHLGLALGYVDKSGAQALAANERVAQMATATEISLIRPVRMQPAKLGAQASWGVSRIKADRLWDAGYTGKGVVVGHLDTGVDGGHPALKGAIASFAEFDLAGNRVPGARPTDSGEHGTHTAGTLVGRPGRKGAFGVAPEAQIASGMVIEGGQVVDRILAGMDWIVEENVRILNMSLGLRGYNGAFEIIVSALRNANVLPVIAVGNEGPNTSRSPGNYVEVLSVGAMDQSDRVAWFSGSQRFSRNDKQLVPDLVAPGVAVLSCIPGNEYAEMDGSSMAAPHVAGLAALLLQAKPEATADELQQAIIASCSLPKTMSESRGNHGVPDAERAFAALTGAELPARVARSVGRRRAPTRSAAKSGKHAAPRKAARSAAKTRGAKSRRVAARSANKRKSRSA